MKMTQRFRTQMMVTAMLAAGLSSQAAITVTTDTATTYAGSFSFTGGDSQTVFPVVFAGLPNDGFLGNGFFIQRSEPGGVILLQLATDSAGSPDNPNQFFFPNTPGSIPSVSGTFNNGGPSGDVSVNWSWSNLIESTAAAGGTFSGDFSFTAVPEPSEYAAVAGASLVAFGLWRRSRK